MGHLLGSGLFYAIENIIQSGSNFLKYLLATGVISLFCIWRCTEKLSMLNFRKSAFIIETYTASVLLIFKCNIQAHLSVSEVTLF